MAKITIRSEFLSKWTRSTKMGRNFQKKKLTSLIRRNRSTRLSLKSWSYSKERVFAFYSRITTVKDRRLVSIQVHSSELVKSGRDARKVKSTFVRDAGFKKIYHRRTSCKKMSCRDQKSKPFFLEIEQNRQRINSASRNIS